ncbi:hypothetical protein RHSIM_Rhsim03G0105500 [Rhododendron simsii]|uniref:Uncharacterized protein n=1 Tax=Rhododendron simsii TaxID=118357 RepID=A0A834LQU5_RHOSS|nr:hypothetical protein RHSIM_Rhsim03G0105500 [Rhododendron simsii]
MVATAIRLRTLSPSQDRYRSISSRRAEGKGAHVKERLGKRVAPYEERIPSLSPDRSKVRGGVRDRLARPKENPRFEGFDGAPPDSVIAPFRPLRFPIHDGELWDSVLENQFDIYAKLKKVECAVRPPDEDAATLDDE